MNQLVGVNSSISGPGLVRSIKSMEGVALSQRTAQRAIRKIRKQNSEAEADAIARLSSFCSKLSNDSPGTIAKVEVSRRNSNWARRFDSHGVVVR